MSSLCDVNSNLTSKLTIYLKHCHTIPNHHPMPENVYFDLPPKSEYQCTLPSLPPYSPRCPLRCSAQVYLLPVFRFDESAAREPFANCACAFHTYSQALGFPRAIRAYMRAGAGTVRKFSTEVYSSSERSYVLRVTCANYARATRALLVC
jgi:hypothetical protein